MICASCGAECAPPSRMPAPEQPPDLDGRPGEPARSALRRRLRVCAGCGAAAPDLSRLPETARATVAGEAYAALSRAEPPAARAPLRWAAILAEAGDAAGAAEATLQAAWAADDAEAPDAAAALRLQAAALWGEPRDGAEALRLADLLRRAGAFDRAGEMVRRAGSDETAARIAAFQAARIAEGDSGRHLMSSAVQPPARRRHAPEERESAGRRFWARLRRG